MFPFFKSTDCQLNISKKLLLHQERKKNEFSSSLHLTKTFFLSFRWFPILASIMGLLSFVVLTHLLVKKCNNYWSNDSVEDVENNETDEQHSIVDFYSALNYIVIISISYSLRFSVQYYFLSPRMSLLLKDSNHFGINDSHSKLLLQKSSASTLCLEENNENINSAS